MVHMGLRAPGVAPVSYDDEEVERRALAGEGSWTVARALGISVKRAERLFARLRRAGRIPPRRPDDRGGAVPKVSRATVRATLQEEGYPKMGALTRAAVRLGYNRHYLGQRLAEEREYGEGDGSC